MVTHQLRLSPRENPDANRGPVVIQTSIPVMALAALALFARLLSRHIKKHSLTMSDYLIIAGFLGSTGVSTIVLAEVPMGLGRHLEVVQADPKYSLTNLLLTTLIAEVIWATTLTIVKISILLLWRELFPGKKFSIATYVLGAITIGWGISTILVAVFACKPVSGFWHPEMIPEPQCINLKKYFLSIAIPNITVDAAILALPFFNLWRLQLDIRSKVAVGGMVLLGAFVIVASIIRLTLLVSIDQTDVPWTFVGVATWSAVENSVAVISACLPTIRPLIVAISPLFFSSGSRNNTAPGRYLNLRDTLTRAHPHADFADSDSYNRLHEGSVFSDNPIKLDSYSGSHQAYVGKEDLSDLERQYPFHGNSIRVRTDIAVSSLDDQHL